MSRLDRIQSTDTGVNLVQDRVARALETAPGSIQDGRLMKDVPLAAGTPSAVAHLLGRPPVGAIPVLASLKAKFAITDPTSTHITLESDTSGIYSFWVF
jgi:hypothetical protein